MQLGIIGLGRMGGNIARRLMLNGHSTVVYDRNTAFVDTLAQEGATGVADLPALVAGLAKPRAVWVMLPAGAPTEDTIETLSDRYRIILAHRAATEARNEALQKELAHIDRKAAYYRAACAADHAVEKARAPAQVHRDERPEAEQALTPLLGRQCLGQGLLVAG